MSRLNDINSSYGKRFGVAIANTTAEDVMKAEGLPKNFFIIASPSANGTHIDFGAHSLIVTDASGVPTRMTYSMSAGNGLVISDGTLNVSIDNYTIKESDDGKLYVDIQNLIDSNSIVLQNGQIVIDAQSLTKASTSTFGVVKIDGRTIKSQNGTINVDTQRLDLGDDNSGLIGILKGGSDTVKATHGVLSVNGDNLTKASELSYGIAKVGHGINSYNGVISVDINALPTTSSQNHGIGKADNITLKEIDGVLSLYYDSIGKASSTSFGLLRSDNTSIVATNGVLAVKNLTRLQESVLDIGYNIAFLNHRLDIIQEQIANLAPSINHPMIFSFVCDGISAVSLKKPTEYGELPENMETQRVSATFIINTNCPFKLFIDYYDNVSPDVTLYETNYNDIDIYPGNVALSRTFQSTNEQDVRITFSWLCKNYLSNDKTEYSKKTEIKLRVAFANDIEIHKEVRYSISRFNSLYDESINGEDDDIIVGSEIDEPGSHKVRYFIRLDEIPPIGDYMTYGSFLNVMGDSAYSIKDNTKLYHSYTSNGETIHESTYCNLFNETGSAVIYRYGRNMETNDIVERTKRALTAVDLSSRNLVVTAYEVIERRDGVIEVPTNDVSLMLNGVGKIRALYKNSFNNISISECGLRLKETPVGAFLTASDVYKVNDNTNIYHTYSDSGMVIYGNVSYSLFSGPKRVYIERYSIEDPNISTVMTSSNVNPDGISVIAYEVGDGNTETLTSDARLTFDGQGNIKLSYTGELKLC